MHGDKVGRLDDGSSGDREKWEKYLGRTAHLSQAWKDIDIGNALWKSKSYADAIKSWWQTVETYRDTDAAYASLSNIARAQHDLKNYQLGIDAMQALSLLPAPQFHERDMIYANYRHNACVRLADYYEQIANLSLAERFVYLGLHQDTRCDYCGVYGATVNNDLENRLLLLRVRQSELRSK